MALQNVKRDISIPCESQSENPNPMSLRLVKYSSSVIELVYMVIFKERKRVYINIKCNFTRMFTCQYTLQSHIVEGVCLL